MTGSSVLFLLDLDDTLLDTNIEIFIPEYFSTLSSSLAKTVSPDSMLRALIGGTQKMKMNLDPALTLQDVFDAYFYPSLGFEKEILVGELEKYYTETFPGLGKITQQRPMAIQFVDWAISAGHRVAVATNPYFPLQAVEHRLRWAGLPPEKYPFLLISSYERFHFAKEQISYFNEFLAQVGWPDGPMVMVGNDISMDLDPARQAGFPVFWLCDNNDPSNTDIPQGSFSDLQNWIMAAEDEALLPKINMPVSITSDLRAVPAALHALLMNIEDDDWSYTPDPNAWSIGEICCHLRDVENEINIPRMISLLTEKNPFIMGVDSDPWVTTRQYRSQSGSAALTEFIRSRKKLLEILSDNSYIWECPARHSFLGPTTGLELLRIISEHDRAHIQHVWKVRQGLCSDG